MTRFISRSPAHTKRIAKTIVERLLAGRRRPIILALSGELGSGKTTFIQGLARTLGIREKIQSPTFVLMKIYKISPRSLASPRLGRGRANVKSQMFHHLIHIDAYRIKHRSEARHLGLKEIFNDQDAIIVVEWAELIRKLVPRGAVWIRFKHGKKSQERSIKLIKRVKQVKRVK